MSTDPAELPPPATEQAIRQLAKWIAEQKVLLYTDVEPYVVKLVFIPIGLGALAGYPVELLRQISIFAVHGVDHSTGYSINGHPMFTECRLWRTADFVAAVRLAVQVLALMKSVLGDVVTEDVPIKDQRLTVAVPDLPGLPDLVAG